MSEEKVLQILSQHVPSRAIPYCHSIWKATPFNLKITRSRHTKAGDFFCARNQEVPRITLNQDLNPYLFLVTYLHEVAHLHVFRKQGNKTLPHGKEWKESFRQIMAPVLSGDFFPEPVLVLLLRHMENPKASSFADVELTKAFRLYDPMYQEIITVSDLPEGSTFVLRGKHFKRGQRKRTRFLCHEMNTKRKYLVPSEAVVSEVQFQLF